LALCTWYGTEMTTMFLRNKSLPLRRRALWLCNTCSYQRSTMNSGMMTVIVSLS